MYTILKVFRCYSGYQQTLWKYLEMLVNTLEFKSWKNGSSSTVYSFSSFSV